MIDVPVYSVLGSPGVCRCGLEVLVQVRADLSFVDYGDTNVSCLVILELVCRCLLLDEVGVALQVSIVWNAITDVRCG